MKPLSISRFFGVLVPAVLIMLSVLLVLLGIFGVGTITLSKFLACTFISAVIGLTVEALYGARGKLTFDLTHAAPVYGVFYVLYYVLPFFGALVRDRFEYGEESYIAFIILLGAICWHIGMYAVPKQVLQKNSRGINEKAAMALLVVLGLSALVVLYGIVWRIQDGSFYNQARYIELETTVADSVRGVLATQLQLPIILLLGMVAGLQLRRFRTLPTFLLVSYGITTVLVLMLSSQTRPAITALLFLILGYGLKAPIRWNIRILSTLALSSVLIVVLVQGFRITRQAEFASAPNQFIYAVENVLSSTYQVLGNAEDQTLMMDAVGSRASGGIDFLGVVVKKIDGRGQPFWGEGIFLSLESLVPRVFWADKPAAVSMQLVMQQLLGFTELYDASSGPLVQFYFEGGLLGVAIGYALFGWGLGWLTKKAFETGAIGWWICLAFVWGTAANLELELVLGFLGAIRGAALMYVIWMFFTLVWGGGTRGRPRLSRGDATHRE